MLRELWAGIRPGSPSSLKNKTFCIIGKAVIPSFFRTPAQPVLEPLSRLSIDHPPRLPVSDQLRNSFPGPRIDTERPAQGSTMSRCPDAIPSPSGGIQRMSRRSAAPRGGISQTSRRSAMQIGGISQMSRRSGTILLVYVSYLPLLFCRGGGR